MCVCVHETTRVPPPRLLHQPQLFSSLTPPSVASVHAALSRVDERSHDSRICSLAVCLHRRSPTAHTQRRVLEEPLSRSGGFRRNRPPPQTSRTSGSLMHPGIKRVPPQTRHARLRRPASRYQPSSSDRSDAAVPQNKMNCLNCF